MLFTIEHEGQLQGVEGPRSEFAPQMHAWRKFEAQTACVAEVRGTDRWLKE